MKSSLLIFTRKDRQQGMLYLAILIVVAISSVVGLKVTQVIAVQMQRDAELDLLQAGREMRTAIGQYYESSPGSLKLYPATLEVLLQDERFLGIRRHLRKIRIDPITKQQNWVLIKAVQGGIQGVSSASDKAPIRKGQFLITESNFENARTYQDWKFTYTPKLNAVRTSETSPSDTRKQ
jgi:type II secretory pathway pseudopilin PulG